eukprot:1161201-Prymnesium_polylepis.1
MQVGNVLLKQQRFTTAFEGMLKSGAGVCVGQPLTAQPAMRGGVESEESMAFARRLVKRQILISALQCQNGLLRICSKGGRSVDVGPDDAV